MALTQRHDRAAEIGFVWRFSEISPELLQMAQRTGSRVICDCSLMEMDGVRSFLQKADFPGHVQDIKISVAAFFDPSLRQVLKESGTFNIWIEGPRGFLQEDTSVFLRRLRELSEDHRCFPIIGDPEHLSAVLKERSGIDRVVLKGCEASGFVSSETTMALYAIAREALRDSSNPPDIIIWGGVATPEAAAAFLSTGAIGIVFESIHWLTSLVAIDEPQRRRLANLRLDSTDLVGLDLQVPCRLFNKGNSRAFKEIRTFEDALCGKEITEESRRTFAHEVHTRMIHPLESRLDQDEVIPLGVEAAFAVSFVERFGAETESAVNAFMGEIRTACNLAESKKDCFLDSPVAGEMGTRYPFVQGAMSWITDVPEFAADIADAGGLPTVALGLMDTETLDRKLGALPAIMKGRPYAVNFISLAENPFREMQVAWIKKQTPRFVVIAGGDLSSVRELSACGIEVIYIAPDEALLRLALEAGVRYVVCEGYEAGGHVSQHSTLTLAQTVLDMKRRVPSLFRTCRVILAGGIYNRETAFLAAMLGADAVQMGTAYLATREIVETGALTEIYQRMTLASSPGGTVVTGRATGLRVRSLRTPKTAAIVSLERAFAAGHQDEASFRTKMEEMAAGSLFTAARCMDKPGGLPLDELACRERGQFMSGACAGVIRNVRTLQSLHRELAEGPLVVHQPVVGVLGKTHETPKSDVIRGPIRTAFREYDHERIAITGMSIINTLGASPEDVWVASRDMKCGITVVPPARWDHALYYDSRPQVPDKTYCNVGAFLDFHVSRNELGIPPHDFRTMTAATKNTMWLAERAIRASGILDSGIPRERIGVLISQNSGEAAGTLTDMIIRAYVHDILGAVKRAIPLTPDQERAVEREVKSGRMAPDDTTLLGRLNCAAAGFICNRYGFMGPSFAVSAACATSLVALYSALQMIRNGIIDAAIVGGCEDDLTHLHFLEFSALGALYGVSGRERPPCETSRPFDAERDGMVLGEGGGMIVIERESLARARGARIHSFVTGMGASNNHLGMVESASIAQQMSIQASFRGIPYGPDDVDLVECHATSTRQGDVEEVRALKTFFKPHKRTVLTSFKSQIGHTLGASGINNLIRGTMAMQTGIFPATLNCEHPDPDMGLEGSGLLIPTEPLDWKRRDGEPRRLQVNAFGFGGSNYVVQIEQAMDETDTILVRPESSVSLAAKKADRPPAIQGISFFRTEVDGRNYRMAVLAQSDEEALTVIERSAACAESGIASPRVVRSLAQQGIFMSPEDLPVPPLAFVFPGQGAQYGGMGRELYDSIPIIREWMDRAAAAAEFDLLHLLFNDQEEDLQKTRWQQPAMFALENAMARYLTTLGIRPVAMAGHSLGELTALCMAGVYSPEDGFRIVNKRALCMDKAAGMHADPGVMAAVDVPPDLLHEMLRGQDDVHIGNINAPNQIVLSGNTDAVRNLCKSVKERGYRATLLRVSMAFHSPVMKSIHDELAAYIASIPFHAPQIPVISNTTREPYPSDPDEIRRILMAHLESTVHWMDNVRTLWDDHGVRLFLEVGPGDILSSLIADTLSDASCIQTCIPPAESAACRTALAQLFAHGHLKVRREPRVVSLAVFRKASAAVRNGPTRQEASPAIVETSASQEHIEALIQIIMDTTGFNRDEIQPDMDLRKDLSIRSSRLPIIMDAAERHFGISIELEDFINVRTVSDIARKISDIVARKEGTGEPPVVREADPPEEPEETLKTLPKEVSIKRLVFRNVPVQSAESAPIRLNQGDSVLFLSPDKDDEIAGKVGDIFRQDYRVDTVPMLFLKAKDPESAGYEVWSDEESCNVSERISTLASLAGMVITLPKGWSEKVHDIPAVSLLLRSLFLPLKAFLHSPARKFVVLIHCRNDAETPGRLLAEGMLGLFLSAAQEYASVQFRTLEIESTADLRAAVSSALDRGYSTIEMICRDEKIFTSEGQVAPSIFSDHSRLKLDPGDVVVISGGATGISAHLARSLAPFRPHLVFLGRTSLDAPTASARTGSKPMSADTNASGHRSEIARTLSDLHAAGIEATYYACDVTDPEAVGMVLDEVAQHYGRIDGIVHGAGVLRDGFLEQMTPDALSMVADVKVLGAWNLFTAAEKAGLKFFVGLSSVASIQGNPGQTNYAAANRMMSALIRYLHLRNETVCFKAFMLPPVEGTGMADDAELRELLKRKGVGYIHRNELAGLFCRELFAASAADDWVMFMRNLPSVRTALINDAPHPFLSGDLDGGTVSFSTDDFPMIEKISHLDIRGEEVEVFRTFSPDTDLWIADHKPFTFIRHPLVSAAMILETFMEAARILYPHLHVRGVRNVRLMDMIQCPPGIPRPARIYCRRTGNELQEIVCDVSLDTQEISPAGRLTDRFTPHCIGQVMLGGSGGGSRVDLPDFPVKPDELLTGPMDQKHIRAWYKDRSGLQGRYRVMEFLDGAGPAVVRGRTIYRETSDFATLRNALYQYSPYLFEALLQLVGFHVAATDPTERRTMIPLQIGEMRFLRKCRAGEAITLEARMREHDEEGVAWDARGIDDQGQAIMQIRTMRMHWVSD